MNIKKMTATFGALDHAVLEPSTGLTVITAPNETGKSTWAGFLKAMLYGIDTKERDKAGFLADKTRYQPWSGAPMAGELQVEWQGKDITIRRFPAKNHPFGGFEAVYTATGDPVPGLTAANVGEQLTGAGKEVFLRSAFVGQNGTAVTHSGELEARIAALATSGQEDVSRSEAERTLKDWRNRRHSNRSNGLIPELEGELREVEESLRSMEQARTRQAELTTRCGQLTEEAEHIQADLELWRRIEGHDLNRRYGQALEQLEQAQAACQALTPPIPEVADWTAQEIRTWAAAEEAEYHEALRVREKALADRAALEKKSRLPGVVLLVLAIGLAAVGLALTITGGLNLHSIDPTLCFILILAGCGCFLFRNQHLRQTAMRLEEMEIPDLPEREDWDGEAQRHTDYLAQKDRLLLEVSHARQRAEDLAAQGAAPYDTLELLHPPAQPKAALEARLHTVQGELARCQSEQARLEGALHQMGDPDVLEARRGELEEQLLRRTQEFDALNVAMEALDEADADLRERFSPALNQTAGEIFSALTGGRWPGLSLARDFSARAEESGALLPRSALALSAGTADQLYLAVRLAICRLTLPDAPILLDDALAAFDDGRMALALDYLSQLSGSRQVLLFSCHSREAQWAEERGVPVISLL